MRKLVLLMHTSLDGFVAGPNGEMDWIYVGDDMFDIADDRTDEADTALYGRVTYDMMEGYWPNAGNRPGADKHAKHHSEWYNRVEKIVVSKTLADDPHRKRKVINENFIAKILSLKEKDGNNILIIGSPSIVRSLIKENIIDDFWLFLNPVILGFGIPLFDPKGKKISLELVNTKKFDSGVICLHYKSN